IYMGLHTGGAVDHFAFKYFLGPPSPGLSSQGSSGITARGPLGGLQIGGNYEFSLFPFFHIPLYHIVAGIEIDDSAADITGQATVSNDIRSRLPYNATFGTRVEDFGTGRLRLGYAFGRFLPYATGGFAFAVTETYYNFSSPMFIASGASTVLRSGWPAHVGCIGMGAEYAITPSLSAKAEYVYVGINARRTLFSSGDDTLVSFGTRTMFHVIRLGLNYKFDLFSPSPPPVAARY
ncbi:MAG: porin family protein, partial [Methylocapsa sp.]|nr:porin family protein [Methylocapsa sp.]